MRMLWFIMWSNFYISRNFQVIPANGIFILGQEQDEVGRNFSAGEAFSGQLSQFNLWNKVLPRSDIEKMSMFRCDHVAGNVIAWTDFSKLTTDDLKKEHVFCQGIFSIFKLPIFLSTHLLIV